MMKVFADTKENHFEFELADDNGESYLAVHGKKWQLRFQKKSAKRYLLTRGQKTYNIIISQNEQYIDVLVNGTAFRVKVLDEHTQKMLEVIKSRTAGQVEKTLKAQIPGLIADVVAETGRIVKEGQTLLILEAMKMENVIKAPFDGQVSQIMVKARETVIQDQPLLKIKPV